MIEFTVKAEDGDVNAFQHEAKEFLRELAGRGFALSWASIRYGSESNPQVRHLTVPGTEDVTPRGKRKGA